MNKTRHQSQIAATRRGVFSEFTDLASYVRKNGI